MTPKEKTDYRRMIAERDFKWLAGRVEGRRFMRRLLQECGVYSPTFSQDHGIMSFQEGKRALGLWILEQFENEKELYIQLLTDKQDDT